MAYRPSNPPPITDLMGLLEYVVREFEAVASSQAEVEEIELRPVHVEPTKPREGMIVFADGTDWNPGSGKGVYTYSSGVWSRL